MGFILDGLESESYDRQYSDRDLRRMMPWINPKEIMPGEA